ncbi:MAG: hypothetical protein DCC71_01820 [Proteobacteria bacterium]|nr:MAG: hypothetical protein DCC71_01820 [Pseudomonadota bacterium]
MRRAAAALAGLGVVAMTLLGTADVVGRFALGRPLLGQVEVTRILLVWVAFLGLAEAERAGGHVRLAVLDPWLGARGRARRDCAVAVLAACVAGGVAVAAALHTLDAWRGGDTLIAPIALPAWIARLGVAVGFAGLAVELAARPLRRTVAWIRR